jgi:hypothetical protein
MQPLLSQVGRQSTVRLRLARGMMALFFLAGIVYACSFKVMDRDFWWHITAGKVMLQQHALIDVDPFAYTREGMPYLSNREWLAQIIFSVVYGAGGSTGIILLRTALVIIAFGTVLAVGFSVAWPLTPLVFWAAHLSRPSLMDRPQLFTFAMMGIALLLAVRTLKRARVPHSSLFTWPTIIALLAVQILWVNTHGAASIFGIIILGLLLLQRSFDAWHTKNVPGWNDIRQIMFLTAGLVVVSLLSPETYRVFTDLWTLPSDPALWIVKEWKPLAAGDYWQALWIFWVVALGCCAWSRRDLIFWLPLVLMTGVMSILSFRHIILFTMVAGAATLYQLSNDHRFHEWMDRLWDGSWKKAAIASTGMLIVIITVGWMAYRNDASVLRRQGLAGYGEQQICKGAADFIEQEKLSGPMFNSYNVGSYLIFRGYPTRKVFLDGRNVEHGFERINRSLLAAEHPEDWKTLSNTYGFTYAVMDILLMPENRHLFFYHLADNAQWKLVFLDDVSMVYLKDIPQNKTLIREQAFRFVTPERMEFGTLWGAVPEKQRPKAEAELRRMMSSSNRNLKAAILLAELYRDSGRWQEAQAVLIAAKTFHDFRPEVYEQLGLLAMAQGDWKSAGAQFEEAIRRSGGSGPQVDYAFLSKIFERAGDYRKALYYGSKAGPSSAPQP